MDARYYHIYLTGDGGSHTVTAHGLKTCEGFLESYLDDELVAKYVEGSLKGYRVVEQGSSEHNLLELTR